MADRFDLVENQTECLALHDPWSVLPTVRDVLQLQAIADALPEMLSGSGRLDSPVRWVHVSDSLEVAQLLNGGELLLSTGAGWSTDAQALRQFVEELVRVRAAGLVVELGARLGVVPPPLIEACQQLGFPLIVLHKVVKFVAVTEAVHSRIISEQTSALRARDQLRELFTGLSLRGSPPDFIVRQLSQALQAPVVLENLSHEVIAVEGEGVDVAQVLADWDNTSRAAHRAAEEGTRTVASNPENAMTKAADSTNADWSLVPVEARGTRWGFLIALPGDPHPAGRDAVLEQGAIALALGRLAEREGGDEWLRIGQQNLLDTLLSGRYASAAGLTARLEAAGLPVADHTLIGLVLTTRAHSRIPLTAPGTAAVAVGAIAIAGALGNGSDLGVLLSIPGGRAFDERKARRFAGAFALAADIGVEELTMGVGSAAAGVSELLTSLQEATELIGSTADTRQPALTIRFAQDRPLLRLVTALRDDPRVQQHAQSVLKPLIDYDRKRGGDLMAVLTAVLAHPTSRTAAAAASHLSRSVFYQRLTLIGDLLGTDLDDGETLASLHVALLAR